MTEGSCNNHIRGPQGTLFLIPCRQPSRAVAINRDSGGLAFFEDRRRVQIGVLGQRMRETVLQDDANLAPIAALLTPFIKKAAVTVAGKTGNGTAEWLNHPVSINDFTPLSREEAPERYRVSCIDRDNNRAAHPSRLTPVRRLS